MQHQEAFNLCQEHMNKYVRLHMQDGAVYDGIIEKVDGEHVYIASPVMEEEEAMRAPYPGIGGGVGPGGPGFGGPGPWGPGPWGPGPQTGSLGARTVGTWPMGPRSVGRPRPMVWSRVLALSPFPPLWTASGGAGRIVSVSVLDLKRLRRLPGEPVFCCGRAGGRRRLGGRLSRWR